MTQAQLEIMALDLERNPPPDNSQALHADEHAMIRTEGLTKLYGKITVVEDLALDVRPGDRYGFLGPNGSGKSTTVRMLLGLVFAFSGSIEGARGADAQAFERRAGAGRRDHRIAGPSCRTSPVAAICCCVMLRVPGEPGAPARSG